MKFFNTRIIIPFFMLIMTTMTSYCISPASIPYVITNNTGNIFTSVKISDEDIRDTDYTIHEGENTVYLYEDYNFIINLTGWFINPITIIVQPGKKPTCYPSIPYHCTFDDNAPNSVIIR